MRVGDANDRFVIPINNIIQETHRAGVGDEGANFGLIDSSRIHSVTVINITRIECRRRGELREPGCEPDSTGKMPVGPTNETPVLQMSIPEAVKVEPIVWG